jgi:hypothetical protein
MNSCLTLCRYYVWPGEDVYTNPDQSQIAVPLVEQLLAYASGKDAEDKPLLTIKDLSKALAQRAADAQATNPEFTTSFVHRTFGSSKFVLLLSIVFELTKYLISAPRLC